MTDERRDEWGETAGERHDRILARDLAWVSYSADPDVPSDGPAHIAFNAGYAAAWSTVQDEARAALAASGLDFDTIRTTVGTWRVRRSGTRFYMVAGPRPDLHVGDKFLYQAPGKDLERWRVTSIAADYSEFRAKKVEE